MIKGFEDYTHELTDRELLYLPILIKVLKARTKKDKPISAKQITEGFKEHFDAKMPGARIRKMINVIRVHGLLDFVVGTGKGYYTTTNTNELKDYADSLTERISAQQRVLDQVNHFIAMKD